VPRPPETGRGRSVLFMVALGLLGARVAAAAEVAVVKSSDAVAWRPTLDALHRMAIGHTLTEYDLRGDRTLGEKVVSGLKGHAAALVAMGPLAAQLCRELLPDLPLVFCMVQDPARVGLNPGPNLTGVSFNIPPRNQLAAFRIVYPRAGRLGILYNEANTGRLVAEAQKAAVLVRLALQAKSIGTERDVPVALRALLSGPDEVDAIWLMPEPLLLSEESRRYLFAETLKAGKPVYSFSASLVAEGALASNGPDFVSIGEQAGELVKRLLAGERHIELLVPRAELVINTKIASKLKITIPPEALQAARRF
jgi:putative tryptophan/tyrosine transport system substrate-binding protein